MIDTEPHRPINDPGWVLDRYREAKELIGECLAAADLPDDLRLGLNEWSDATTMDECTTFDRECTCNPAKTPEQWAHHARLEVEARLGGQFRTADAEAVESVLARIKRDHDALRNSQQREENNGWST